MMTEPRITEHRDWRIQTAQPNGSGDTVSVKLSIDFPLDVAGQVLSAMRDGPGGIPLPMRSWQLKHLPDPKKDMGDEVRREFLSKLGLKVRRLLGEHAIPAAQLIICVEGLEREITICN